MDLQSVFYILGIIFIVSWLVFFFGMIALGFYIHSKIKGITKETVEQVNEVRNMSKMGIAGMIGKVVVGIIADKINKSRS